VVTKSTSPTASAKTAAAALTSQQTPAEVLSAALQALGYDPSSFKMESREEWVEYPGPGGGYWNRYTHVDLPNGAQENFSTDLMMKYPTVTANEIKRLMNMPLGAALSGLY
jgi:hypothetical protein